MDKREAAEKEWQDVKNRAAAEEEKVTQVLIAENRYMGGLDTNTGAYKYIYNEMRKRIKEIQGKYKRQ